MTDRELLELAAKAAGLPVDMTNEGGIGWFACGKSGGGETVWWNPLKSDGDALRLAVKLRLACDFSEDDIDVISWAGESGALTGEADNGDRQSCARRAIVRAAAEIGRAALAQEGP